MDNNQNQQSSEKEVENQQQENQDEEAMNNQNYQEIVVQNLGYIIQQIRQTAQTQEQFSSLFDESQYETMNIETFAQIVAAYCNIDDINIIQPVFQAIDSDNDNQIQKQEWDNLYGLIEENMENQENLENQDELNEEQQLELQQQQQQFLMQQQQQEEDEGEQQELKDNDEGELQQPEKNEDQLVQVEKKEQKVEEKVSAEQSKQPQLEVKPDNKSQVQQQDEASKQKPISDKKAQKQEEVKVAKDQENGQKKQESQISDVKNQGKPSEKNQVQKEENQKVNSQEQQVNQEVQISEIQKQIIKKFTSAENAFAAFDKNQDNYISQEEFNEEIKKCCGGINSSQNEQLNNQDIFKKFDLDQDGKISKEEWKLSLNWIKSTQQEVDQMSNDSPNLIGQDFPEKEISDIQKQNISKQIDSNKREDIINMFPLTPQRDQDKVDQNQLKDNQPKEQIVASQEFPQVLMQAKNCKNFDDLVNQLNQAKLVISQKNQPQWDQRIFEAFNQKKMQKDYKYSPGKSMDLEISSKPLLYKTSQVVSTYKTPKKDLSQEVELEDDKKILNNIEGNQNVNPATITEQLGNDKQENIEQKERVPDSSKKVVTMPQQQSILDQKSLLQNQDLKIKDNLFQDKYLFFDNNNQTDIQRLQSKKFSLIQNNLVESKIPFFHNYNKSVIGTNNFLQNAKQTPFLDFRYQQMKQPKLYAQRPTLYQYNFQIKQNMNLFDSTTPKTKKMFVEKGSFVTSQLQSKIPRNISTKQQQLYMQLQQSLQSQQPFKLTTAISGISLQKQKSITLDDIFNKFEKRLGRGAGFQQTMGVAKKQQNQLLTNNKNKASRLNEFEEILNQQRILSGQHQLKFFSPGAKVYPQRPFIFKL